MAILPILVAPDPRLKETAKPVDEVNDEIRKLMDDMLETMYAAPGIGLAAIQVGVLKRVIVIDLGRPEEKEKPADLPEDRLWFPSNPLQLANPELTWTSDDQETLEEGCLSVPNYFEDVERPAKCKIKYLDYDNKPQEMEADGLLAACIQHEIDHLNGMLFVDHLSRIKRNMALKKLDKAKKQHSLRVNYPVDAL